MKQLLVIALILIVLGGLIFCNCAVPAPTPAPTPAPAPTPVPVPKSETIELTMAFAKPAVHTGYTVMWTPWFNKVQEVTKGRVKVTGFPGATIAKSPDQYDAVVNKLADIVEHWPSHKAGLFPLTQIMELPNVLPASELGAHQTVWEAYRTIPEIQKEFSKVKVLWMHITPPNLIITREKPVYTLEDLKGMKIDILGIAPKDVGDILGFVATPLQMTDLYVSMEKGVIDGMAFPYGVFPPYKIAPLCKYVTEYGLGGNTSVAMMNLDKWNSLPSDIQNAIMSVCGDAMVKPSADYWAGDENSGKQMAKDAGIKSIQLSPQEKARWDKALEPLIAKYIDSLEAKGLPGKKVLADILKISQKYLK